MIFSKKAKYLLLWFLHNQESFEKLLRAHSIKPKSIYKEKVENKPPSFRAGE